MMSPRAVLKMAQRVGYDAIAVTDHYTYDKAIRGTLATHRLSQEFDVTAYKGLEYHVGDGPHKGHVLLYFDHVEQVPERGLTLRELVDHARDHDLTLIHPHPYGFGGIQAEWLLHEADYVELNGSYGRGTVNDKLLRQAKRQGISHKLIANSDAHARGQMGAAYTITEAIEDHVADTLATRKAASLAEPHRAWGRAAKMARAVLQPVGWAMNTAQRFATRRALRAIDPHAWPLLDPEPAPTPAPQ